MPGILISALYDLFFKQSFYFIYACMYTVYVHACLHSCVNVGMHTCHGVQPWVFVLAFHPVWDRVSLSLAGLWVSGDSPISDSHLPARVLGLQMFLIHSQLLHRFWAFEFRSSHLWQVLNPLSHFTNSMPTISLNSHTNSSFTKVEIQLHQTYIICTDSQVVKQGFRSRLLLSQ